MCICPDLHCRLNALVQNCTKVAARLGDDGDGEVDGAGKLFAASSQHRQSAKTYHSIMHGQARNALSLTPAAGGPLYIFVAILMGLIASGS